MKNVIGKATMVYALVLVAVISVISVAGCGYSSASGGLSTQDVPIPTMDIADMKATALSNLVEGTQRIVNAGGGCVAELTIDPPLQRIVSDVLSRQADTNDAGVGWAVLMSANDGAVLALADCGGAVDEPRPFALTRMFMPGHLLSTLTVAAAFDAGIATPDSELFTDASEAFYYQYKLPGD